MSDSERPVETAAKPYARLSETTQGDWSEHMWASPPSHEDAVLKSDRGESFLLQMATGLETSALSGQEQDPLQQSL